jgi:hypothetical protein
VTVSMLSIMNINKNCSLHFKKTCISSWLVKVKVKVKVVLRVTSVYSAALVALSRSFFVNGFVKF